MQFFTKKKSDGKMYGTSPEWQLLLLCCKNAPSNSAISPSGILPQNINWKLFLTMANRHAVIPQVFSTLLQESSKLHVPEWVIDELKRLRKTIAFKSLNLTQELIRIIKIFQTHQIEIIPYKGSILALKGYGALGLRYFGDIDFLFQKKDFSKIEEILIANNYQPEIHLSSLGKKFYLWNYCEYNFDYYKEKKRIFHVEPHWTVGVKRFQIDLPYQKILPFTRREKLLSVEVNMLTPEGLILTTALHHGARDHWQKMKYVCDMAVLIHRYQHEINWKSFMKALEKLKVKNLILCGIAMTHELLDVDIPTAIQPLVKQPKIKNNVDKLISSLLEELFFKAIPGETFLRSLLFHLAIRQNWSTKCKVIFYHLLRFVTPPLKYNELSPHAK